MTRDPRTVRLIRGKGIFTTKVRECSDWIGKFEEFALLKARLTIDGYIDEKEVFKIVIESLKYGGKV